MWHVQESIGGRAGGARLEKEMEGTIHGTADELSERAALDNDKEPDEEGAPDMGPVPLVHAPLHLAYQESDS